MVVIVCVALALTAAVTTSVAALRYRSVRRGAQNPMAHAFGEQELCQLDAHLEAVACEELCRLEKELAHYLAGRAGHVVVVWKEPHGIALELSDGRRLVLRGISTRTVEVIDGRARMDMLRPESLDRDAFSCRLLLRGADGTGINVYARNVALACLSIHGPMLERNPATGLARGQRQVPAARSGSRRCSSGSCPGGRPRARQAPSSRPTAPSAADRRRTP